MTCVITRMVYLAMMKLLKLFKNFLEVICKTNNMIESESYRSLFLSKTCKKDKIFWF